MQKQAPNLGRILVMVGFALSCFGLLLFLWLAFGGPTPLKPKGYRFTTSFGEATQLAVQADVRISGVSVGKVMTIEPDPKAGRSRVEIQLEPDYAPLPKNTRTILRQKTLLGETYVELTPGSPKAGWVADGGELPPGQVKPTVELDEIQRLFDKDTRAAFQSWQQDFAKALDGRSQDVNDAIGNLAPFAEDATALLTILNSQEGAVQQLVRNTGEVFGALSERQGQLRSLISNSNRVFRTTAERDQALADTFRALPTFQQESQATLERLTEFAQDTDPLITQLRPAARQLSPTLQELEELSPVLKRLFTDLDPLIDASEKGLPATEAFLDELHPLLGSFDPFLSQLNPMLRFIGLYKDEITAFFANSAAATQATNVPASPNDPRIHYLRTTNPLNLESLAVYPKRLPTNRTNPYAKSGLFRNLKDGLPSYETRQCTGETATQLPIFGDQTPSFVQTFTPIVQTAFQTLQAASTATAAPPCVQQTPFDIGGRLTQFPQIRADANGQQTTFSRSAPRSKQRSK